MDKVVKCNGCGQYFMLTDKARKCPFCKTEYGETGEEKPASSGGKENKEATKTPKKSFKIWNNN